MPRDLQMATQCWVTYDSILGLSSTGGGAQVIEGLYQICECKEAIRTTSQHGFHYGAIALTRSAVVEFSTMGHDLLDRLT